MITHDFRDISQRLAPKPYCTAVSPRQRLTYTVSIMSLVTFTSPSGRLQLRSPELSDATNILHRIQDPQCVAHLPHLRDGKFTLQGITSRIASWRESASETDLFLVIVLRDGQKLIGDGGFEMLDHTTETGEAGVMLNSDPQVRGKGYAIEALEATFQYGFTCLGLQKIILRTLKKNVPMGNLLKKHFQLTPEYREVEAGTECVFTMLKDNFIALHLKR
jgi:RimJ/RimL family protein N-acetyltransferase